MLCPTGREDECFRAHPRPVANQKGDDAILDCLLHCAGLGARVSFRSCLGLCYLLLASLGPIRCLCRGCRRENSKSQPRIVPDARLLCTLCLLCRLCW